MQHKVPGDCNTEFQADANSTVGVLLKVRAQRGLLRRPGSIQCQSTERNTQPVHDCRSWHVPFVAELAGNSQRCAQSAGSMRSIVPSGLPLPYRTSVATYR